jgi:hypothetical protein
MKTNQAQARKGNSAQILSLVPHTVSKDMCEALSALLQGAIEGQITGLIFAVTLRGGRVVRNVYGQCEAQPLLARGIVANIDDDLKDLYSSMEDTQ